MHVGELLRFFLPLALAGTLMGTAHTATTAILARTADPEQTLATLALALGAATVIEAPFVMVRHLSLTLSGVRRGLRRTAQVVAVFLFPLLALEFLLAYTSGGRYILSALLAIPDSMVTPVVVTYRVMMFMAPATALRFLCQGFLVRYQQTAPVSLGILVRMVYTVAGGLAMVTWLPLPGAVIGGLLLIGGIACEALVCGWFTIRRFRSVVPLEDHALPTLRDGVRLFAPLALSAGLASVVSPVVNMNLAQTAQPSLALTAYAMAYVVGVPIWLPMLSLHQVAVVFAGNDHQGHRRTARFALLVSAVASSVLASLAYTPLGTWLLDRVLGLSPETARAVRLPLSVQVFLPVIVAWGDYCLGRLLLQGRTRVAGFAKTINVLTVIAVTTVGVRLARSASTGAMVAASAFVLGYAVEGACNWIAVGWRGRAEEARGGSPSPPAQQTDQGSLR